MPSYVLINKATGEEHEEFFTSHSELQIYLNHNPNFEQGVPSKMNIAYRPGTSFKVDDEFKSLLKKIKSENKGGKVNLT